jgi:hypothetical protein
MTDTALSPDAAAALARAATDHLSRLNGALELQATVLALLVPAGSRRAERAWAIETEAAPGAAKLHAHVQSLPGAARLPWFEVLVSRLRGQPLETRQVLLESTRRVMGARGAVRPIDRLHWLAMRQRLGGAAAESARHAASNDLSHLPQAEVSAIARYTAFLSRMVPLDRTDRTDGDDAPGIAWYDAAMAPWRGGHAEVPPCHPPDTDGLVHALQELQALPWMQRPTLLRGWVTAAIAHSRYGRLDDTAADALRLSGALLDSPLPPELARHYAAQEIAR